MNKIWSEQIQGLKTLDLSRKMKFRDDRKELFLDILRLKVGMTIVDVGCGPGTLVRKLSRWLPDSHIIGIDRDTNFIKYARDNAKQNHLTNVSFYEGDALHLPLEDHSVDACISHTVIEHVPNREFLLEQKRICKSNGIISVMFSRPDKYVKTTPDLLPKQSEREIELLEKLFEDSDQIDSQYNVGKYWPDSIELPKLFESLSFKNIQIDAISIPRVIDNSNNTMEEKVIMINSEKDELYEAIELRLSKNKEVLSYKEIDELKDLIKKRIDIRLNYLKNNKKLWDYSIYMIQIVTGVNR